MIVDAHTHVFPPSIAASRDAYLRRDATFAALYSTPKSRIATPEQLISSMDRSGIDVSIALGFGWSSNQLCTEGNETVMAAAAANPRLIAFATVWPGEPDVAYREAERCARGGCRGLGELRPRGSGSGPSYSLSGEAGDALASAARDFDLTLLFHVSEPVGHRYPGKEGLEIAELAEFCARYPDVRVIAAHWGGGLPFYLLMPEMRTALANVWFDTAATSLLYRDDVFRVAASLSAVDRVLFGSDFPLLDQARQRKLIENAPGLSDDDRLAILGENAARLFGLEAMR
ncbi:MAG TPA: amidohydrolase family protein [Dehalococcoidia bacterium]|nr:amidohydrolase family protein [Dehalococcoidia bacterium]